ncbi:hypothetical protein [Nostoc sp.]|uniref:hypothetical protein n=1 Tax=Nostoc sp. TaxID=1180 RepID=UPI002FFA5B7D
MGRKNSAICDLGCGDRIMPIIFDILPYSTPYKYPMYKRWIAMATICNQIGTKVQSN